MTPDDVSIIGPLKFYPNVFLNAGHGGRGTTNGLATAKLVAEQINEGKAVSIEDMRAYSPRRFHL